MLFGLVAWTFFPSLQGAFIEFDDSVYVTENPHIRLTLPNLAWELFNGEAANWHPLTMWTLMLDHQFYGWRPWGYHLTNVLLHSTNAVLLFLVLRRMTGATWRSLLVAALFGLHPLRVESVAWISERKDVLSVLFWMLTLYAYARYALGRSKVEGRESKAGSGSLVFVPRRWTLDYYLALGFFALGLMSKPMLVTLPLVLLLLDYWPLGRLQLSTLRPLVLEKIPFFLLTTVVSLITYVVQRNGGMMKELAGLSFGTRLENALVSYGRYLGKLFWPADLCALYPHPGHWPAPRILTAALLVLGISVLVLILRRRRPYVVTGWCWYLGTLVPVIGLIQVGSQSMSDRYSYIPSVGILIALVWGAQQLTQGWPFQKAGLGVAGGLLILGCIGLTRQQIGFWKDTATVCRRAIAVTGKNFDAHSRLGRALFNQGQIDEAIREFQTTLQVKPDCVEAYCSLGRTYVVKGRPAEAMAYYRKALEVQPDSAVAHNNLGDLLYQSGRLDESILHSQKALAVEPGNVTALNNLGSALLLEGRTDEALASFQQAVELQPENAMVQNNLGSLLLRVNRVDEAAVHFQYALLIEPNNAAFLNNLGYASYSLGRFDDAIRAYERVLVLQPLVAEAHRNLAYVLVQHGRLDDGIREFQTALKLKPDYLTASNELAAAVTIKELLTRQTNNPASP